jgi:hypothetical protein
MSNGNVLSTGRRRALSVVQSCMRLVKIQRLTVVDVLHLITCIPLHLLGCWLGKSVPIFRGTVKLSLKLLMKAAGWVITKDRYESS